MLLKIVGEITAALPKNDWSPETTDRQTRFCTSCKNRRFGRKSKYGIYY